MNFVKALVTSLRIDAANLALPHPHPTAGGVAQLVMPLIYTGIKQSGVPGFTAWRWSFMVPGAMVSG